MKSPIIFLIDILAIMFIFLNVVAFKFVVFGIPLRYSVLLLLFTLSFVYNNRSSNQLANYFVTVFGSYFLLFIWSLALGNDYDRIMNFITPLFNLLAIPAYKIAFEKYGALRYLNVFALSCLVLLVIFALLVNNPEYALMFGASEDDENSLILITRSALGGGSRVIIKTFSFMAPFAVYMMYRFKGIFYHVFFAFMMLVSILSQTYGIVLTIVFFYFYILFRRKQYKIILTAVAIIVAVIISSMLFVDEVLDAKWASVDVKGQQLANMFKGMNIINILFGRGLGCPFTGFDSRGVTDYVIEVSAVQLFQMGGIFMSWPILNVYLRPIIKMLRTNAVMPILIGSCQFGLFITSLSNPYLWSGTSFIFIIFYIANSVSIPCNNRKFTEASNAIAEINKL